jgi:hypothetical protein
MGDYEAQVGRSTFCGVLPGDGWSGGIVTYLALGCIPVIIQARRCKPIQPVLKVSSRRSGSCTLQILFNFWCSGEWKLV